MAKNGPVKTGEVAVTGSGSLPCKIIIHAVGRIWFLIDCVLRLPYTFRSTIFPEIGFLDPSNSPNVIFHLKKK